MTGAEALAASLVEAAGGHVRAVVLYGSHLLKTRPDEHSAYDFVVVVEDYRAFYAGLRDSGELHRPVWLMSALAGVLPPNSIAFAPDEGERGLAKAQILSAEHFERGLGADPPDHFLLGRMVQKVEVVWAAGPADAQWVEARLAGARGRVLDWMLPYLEEPVDAAGLGHRLLEVCYAGELRPESRGRATRTFEAQEEHFRSIFPAVLERGVEEGVLERVPSDPAHAAAAAPPDSGSARVSTSSPTYRRAGPAPAALARRWRRHFRRSKLRATLRWFKHMVTFANWLPYIQHKVERHTGREIRLTRLERAVPIVFLWPRAIYVLLTRPRKEIRP